MVQSEISNKLLRCLSPVAFASLARHLVPTSLHHGRKLALPKMSSKVAVFPDTGVASVIGNTRHTWQELGLFGVEGVSGLSTLFTPSSNLNLIVVQVPGTGHEIEIEALKPVFNSNEEVRELLLSYLLTFLNQVSHTAIANVQCNAVQRLARWLLMIQDRMNSDRFVITHDYIAAMLGVARTSVTLSLLHLEKQGLISTGRKLVKINKRPELAEVVSQYYGRPEEDYTMIMDARVHRYR